MRVALYARVSTTEQMTDSQFFELRCYVASRHWVIVDVSSTTA